MIYKYRNFRHPFTNPLRKLKEDGGYTSIFRHIGFIGDSLSSGEHESYYKESGKGFHDYYEYSWGQYIARKCGLTAYNFSRGGLAAKTFFDYIKTNDPYCEEKKCECYVIALGVNDMSHLKDYYDGHFGSFADVDWNNEDNNAMSYVGQYVRIIQKLRKLEPKCRIFVLDTPYEVPMKKEEKPQREAIRDFLIELTKKMEYIYLIDLYKYAPYYNKKNKTMHFCGGHMNAAGYKFTADLVSTYIDYYIRKYPDDFKQIAFVGKDVHHTLEKW